MVNSPERAAIDTTTATATATASAPPRRPRGRPRQTGEPLESVSLALPKDDLARLEAEVRAGGAASVSAIVRLAVAEHLRRADKKRERQY